MQTDSFGKIAFGVRCGHGADPVFLKCWTKLLIGGLRDGDAVISPMIELPHHWAACGLAHAFLNNTECDTLCMLDDDMTFEIKDINAMRDHVENYPFGMVQGMCCSRKAGHGVLMLAEGEDGKYHPMTPEPDDKTVEVGMVGLAFTFIRRSAFEAVDTVKPDESLFFNWGEGGWGEDAIFCKFARKAGVRIGVDTEVSIGHRVTIEVSYDKERNAPVNYTYTNKPFLDLLKAIRAE